MTDEVKRLSPHLTLAEVTLSDTAKRYGIDNQPTEAHIDNLKALALAVFEPIRLHFRVPIFVSSGYRSADLNAVTPGASATSQHSLGQALDLDQDGRGTGVTNRMVFDFIRAHVPFDQLIWEYGDDASPDWVHVSYKPRGMRMQVLRAKRGNRGPVYSPMP